LPFALRQKLLAAESLYQQLVDALGLRLDLKILPPRGQGNLATFSWQVIWSAGSVYHH
jgi:hypothetical protein